MNPLDWVLTVVVLYSTVRAAMNGLFRELFTLAGVVAGFCLACWFYPDAARAISGLISTPTLAQFAGFLLIFAAVTLLASLLGRVLRRGARTVGLGATDRLGGALFGLARGAALCATFLLALTTFLPAAPWVQTSLLSPYLLQGAHAVSFTMPRDLRYSLREEMDRLRTAGRLKHTSRDWIKSGFSSHTDIEDQL